MGVADCRSVASEASLGSKKIDRDGMSPHPKGSPDEARFHRDRHLANTLLIMSAGIFAIVGVALGSLLTYAVQSRMARRAEDFATRERLRQERMDAYSALAADTMDARRAQIDRWYQRRDSGRGTPQYEAAKAESYRGRTAARRERYRVELVAADAEMTALAEEAVASLGDIHKAQSKTEMEERAEHTRRLVERFVERAASQLSAPADSENSA